MASAWGPEPRKGKERRTVPAQKGTQLFAKGERSEKKPEGYAETLAILRIKGGGSNSYARGGERRFVRRKKRNP